MNIKSLFRFQKKEGNKEKYEEELQKLRSLMVGKSSTLGTFDFKKGWVYSCINIRARALANSEFIFTKNDIQVPSGHWGELLKENPNSNYTWFDILYLIGSWLDLTGNCYLLPTEMSIGGATFPANVIVLPSNRVRPEVKDDLITHYVVNFGTKWVRYEAEKIIHIKEMSPSPMNDENFFIGQPDIINSIKDVQEIAIKRLDYIENYYNSDGVMPFILSSDSEELGQVEAEQLLKMYNKNIQNPKYKAQSFLPFGMKPENLGNVESGQSTINSDWEESERKRIASAFEVPDTILTHAYSGKAVAEATMEYMNSNVIAPRGKKVAYYWNKYLSSFTDVRIEYVPKVFRNEEFELKKTSTLFLHNAITVNEFREANGFEPLEEAIPNPEDETESGKKSFSNNTEYWYKVDKILKKRESELLKKVLLLFSGLFRESKLNIKEEGIHITRIFDVSKWQEKFSEVVGEEVELQAIDTFERVAEDMDIPIEIPEFQSKINLMVNEQVDLVKDSVFNTHENLKDKVKTIISNNQDLNTEDLTALMIEETSEYMDDSYTEAKASQIVRNTTAGVENKTQYELAVKKNLDKVWITRRDRKVRPSHARLDGKRLTASGGFDLLTIDSEGTVTSSESALYPRGSGNPSEDIECRCFLRLLRPEN